VGEVSTGTDGRVKNAIPIVFPESSGQWGLIQSVWIMDAETGGNAWIAIDLVDPILVSSSNYALAYAAGRWSFRVDD
jgi:hypothetical protein